MQKKISSPRFRRSHPLRYERCRSNESIPSAAKRGAKERLLLVLCLGSTSTRLEHHARGTCPPNFTLPKSADVAHGKEIDEEKEENGNEHENDTRGRKTRRTRRNEGPPRITIISAWFAEREGGTKNRPVQSKETAVVRLHSGNAEVDETYRKEEKQENSALERAAVEWMMGKGKMGKFGSQLIAKQAPCCHHLGHHPRPRSRRPTLRRRRLRFSTRPPHLLSEIHAQGLARRFALDVPFRLYENLIGLDSDPRITVLATRCKSGLGNVASGNMGG
ncbi:hypothetical protein R3P38DRAFT_2811409 [Favolaschia claudopus]|uniref:Uncharacterized protein n=1 Tax=Favolaschia claudopus TaxID=2862362 RepID=A0AAV9Z9U0_9AGAR